MFDIIFESPASTVYKTFQEFDNEDGSRVTRVMAVKTGSCVPVYSPEPHDIVKEARILSRLVHPNVIDLVHAGRDSTRSDLFSIWMPFAEHTLQDLLDSPLFAPATPPGLYDKSDHSEDFIPVVRSLVCQMMSAVAYLHDPAQSIAHRDIKPGNFLLTASGCIKLIDFGISYELNAINRQEDMWPESPGKLYTAVATGSYRAPELLFGAEDYDPYSTDLWSLGCTLAEFFTSVRMQRNDDGDTSDEDVSAGSQAHARSSHIVPAGEEASLNCHWRRDSLFDASRGEIGLAWSIFQARGTPTETSWPGFSDLPNARRLQFKEAEAVPLRSLIPNLPQSSWGDYALDIVDKLLEYPPLRRLRASEVLRHPFFVENEPCLPPAGASSTPYDPWDNKGVGEWIARFLTRN